MAAQSVAAKDPILAQPIDCTLGVDCYIHDYVDRTPGDSIEDYNCGTLTRNSHSGVDFGLFSLADRLRGVNVVAAAPGRVTWVNDGMDDISSSAPNAPDVTGKSCGNGVQISHGGGWVSRYCHMAKGSILVTKGQRVRLQDRLGQVGMSGLSNYPHLHFTLLKNREIIDPFAPDMSADCAGPTQKPLWSTPMPYQSAGWLRAGFAIKSPRNARIEEGIAPEQHIPARVAKFGAWGHFYGVIPGDDLVAIWTYPDGRSETTVATANLTFKRSVRWVSKSPRPGGFETGIYTVTFQLVRDGVMVADITTQTELR